MIRYERTEDILRLVILLQTRSAGLSLADIQEEFAVSRRTAERMRDTVVRLFPTNIEHYDGADKLRRWKFTNATINLTAFSPEELAELESLKNWLISGGLQEKSEVVSQVITKIKSVNKAENTKIENDAEALLQAEGYAIRQYPRFKVKKQHFNAIREAIKAFKKLHIEYRPKDKGKSDCIIHPYGLLYGEKYYLIAYSEPRDDIRMYDLARIEKLEIINEYFDMQENFNLKEYANNSFGVYQEEPFKVKLWFAPEVAEDVKNYHFHPTQRMKEQPDGSVIVQFTAGGSKAICWHLFKWGNLVKILQPASLKKIYKDLVLEAMQSY